MKRIFALISAILVLLCVPAHATLDYVVWPDGAGQPPAEQTAQPDIQLAGRPDAESIYKNMSYSDIRPNDDVESIAVYFLTTQSVLTGGGAFAPDDAAARSDTLLWLYRAFRGTEAVNQAARQVQEMYAGSPGSDVLPEAAGAYLLARDDGLITDEQFEQAIATPDGSKDMQAAVTRQTATAWCVQLAGITPADTYSAVRQFHDYALIDVSCKPYIEAAARLGIIPEDGGYLLRPRQSISRGGLALLLSRFAEHFHDAPVRRSGTVLTAARVEGGYQVEVSVAGGGLDRITVPRDSRHKGDTVVFGGGRMGYLDTLKEKDEIAYWFTADRQVLAVQRLFAADSREQFTVSALYKGPLYLFDNVDGQVVLRGAQRYEAGKWVPEGEGEFTLLPAGQRLYISHGGKTIEAAALNAGCLDKQVYVVMGRFRGGAADEAAYIQIG